MIIRFLLFLISSIFIPAKCFAHVSERALILLLPTEFYIPAGISVLILTILIAYLTPASFISSLFNSYQFKNFNFFSIISDRSFEKIKIITSLFSFLFLIALVYLGFSGSRDPLANPLTLFIWSVWFLLMPVIQITVGNLWAFLNPWYGIGKLFFNKPKVKINDNFSFLFSSAGFLLFSIFMLVYIAPDDPDILEFKLTSFNEISSSGNVDEAKYSEVISNLEEVKASPMSDISDDIEYQYFIDMFKSWRTAGLIASILFIISLIACAVLVVSRIFTILDNGDFLEIPDGIYSITQTGNKILPFVISGLMLIGILLFMIIAPTNSILFDEVDEKGFTAFTWMCLVLPMIYSIFTKFEIDYS